MEKPIWQMNGREFMELSRMSHNKNAHEPEYEEYVFDKDKKYVYGITGIAKLFGCSMPTANRIKKSGKINQAITQIGRKIIVDADLALKLAKGEKGGRS